MWETSDCLTKQLEGIGPVFSQSLAKAGIDSFEKILTADARRIESIVGRNPPFGHNLKETVNKIPRFDISKIKVS
jgi:ATP-dependent DNA helicase HFM1/MER3